MTATMTHSAGSIRKAIADPPALLILAFCCAMLGATSPSAHAQVSGYIHSISPSHPTWFDGCPLEVRVRIKNTGDRASFTITTQNLPSGWTVTPAAITRTVSTGSYYTGIFQVAPPESGGEGIITWLLTDSVWILGFDYQQVESDPRETVSTPVAPSGPSVGQVLELLTFSSEATPSPGHLLEYRFDWGDGAISAWGSATQSHAYASSGTKELEAQARCAVHTCAESVWSASSSVLIDAGPPSLAVSPASRDYGAVQVGHSLDMAFTVQNTGGGTLSGTASAAAPFSVVSGNSYNLSEGASQTATVRYSPTSAGTHNATVTFTGGGGAARDVSGYGRPLPPQITAVQTLSGSQIVLKWTSISGATYSVYGASNLSEGFGPLHTDIPCEPPLNTFTTMCPDGADSYFYSIHAQ